MSNGSKANGSKANGTPAGVNLNNGTPPGPSRSGGPPPGIISGIQPSTTAKTTSSSNVNRATAHGSSKSFRYTDYCFEPPYWDIFTGSCACKICSKWVHKACVKRVLFIWLKRGG